MANNLGVACAIMSTVHTITICPNCQRSTMVLMYIRVYRSVGQRKQKRVGLFCKACRHAIIDAATEKQEVSGSVALLPTT